MNTLGIIPARSGSKRVPDKNIRLLAGKPLILYTIDAANKSKMLLDTIVSTDDEEYADLFKESGAHVPFIRPKELAQDSIGDLPVLLHALDWYQENHKVTIDYIAWLRPTSPFRTGLHIDEAIKAAVSNNASCVRSMTKVGGVHHPYWMFVPNSEGKMRPFDPEHTTDKYYQSQLLPDVYRLNGVIDIFKVSEINKHNTLSFSDIHMIELDDKTSMDIDTEFDFQICELMMQTERKS